MKELFAGMTTRYKAAEKRVADAETALQRASRLRLAQLMKLEPRQRLEQIDDAALTAADRAKLRRSIAVSLRHRKSDAVRFGSRSLFRVARSWLRYVPAAAILVAIVSAPSAVIYKARKNTNEIVVLPQPLDFNWILPNGVMERKTMPAGTRLAIARRSNTSAVARRWIKQQGYATAEVNIRER